MKYQYIFYIFKHLSGLLPVHLMPVFMGVYMNKKQEKNEAAASAKSYTQNSGSLQLINNQPGKIIQRELQEIVNNSLQARQLRNLQTMVDDHQIKQLHLQKTSLADNKQPGGRFSLPAIQRIVDWREEEVETKNPLNVVMPPFHDWGFTNFIINGSENVPKALKPPQLSVEKETIGVSIKVVKEPTNNLGTRMEIPTPPPWTQVVSKKMVGGIYYAEAEKYFNTDLSPYMNGDGNTTLRVRGIPSDNTMVSHTQDHEQHHVNDDVRAREEIVDSWDDALYNMKQTGETFWGWNPESALLKLYKKAGGTPFEIGNRYYERVKQLGIDYHKTEEGGKPPLSGINTSMDQSTIELLFKPH